MNISVISGSRADYGHLQWLIKVLRADSFFSVAEIKIWGQTADQALQTVGQYLADAKPDMVLVLGDRFEIMAAAMAAHLQRIPIAHIGGGDVTEGSYDDAMRDCISRMASYHFVTSTHAENRLRCMGYKDVFLVGAPGVDYILHGEWRDLGMPGFAKPYVLVSYQAETIDDTVDLEAVNEAIAGRPAIWIKPNLDRGNERIPGTWEFSHAQFLSVLANCDEFIGNSSAIYYEAPFLGVKTREIGKRQRGRRQPWGDGKASERIASIIKDGAPCS